LPPAFQRRGQTPFSFSCLLFGGCSHLNSFQREGYVRLGGLKEEVRARTIGILRQGRKHAALLNHGSTRYLRMYLDGVNAFIACGED
jgi:hypothetical protein